MISNQLKQQRASMPIVKSQSFNTASQLGQGGQGEPLPHHNFRIKMAGQKMSMQGLYSSVEQLQSNDMVQKNQTTVLKSMLIRNSVQNIGL